MAWTGLIYAHVFENTGAGIPRTLFWNLLITPGPEHEIGEDDAIQSVACEWLTFPVSAWPQLDGLSLSDCRQPDLVECSIYQGSEHRLGDLQSLHLRRDTEGALFEVSLSLLIAPTVDDELHVPIDLKFVARFDGIIVVPANLSPSPGAPEEAAKVVAALADLSLLHPPVWDRFRYVFQPATPG